MPVAKTGNFTGGGLVRSNEGHSWTGEDSVTIDITSTTSTVRANGTFMHLLRQRTWARYGQVVNTN